MKTQMKYNVTKDKVQIYFAKMSKKVQCDRSTNEWGQIYSGDASQDDNYPRLGASTITIFILDRRRRAIFSLDLTFENKQTPCKRLLWNP